MKNNKRRYRLNDLQANFLGLKLKKINRYTLSEKQENLHLNTIMAGYVTAEKSVDLKESINQNNVLVIGDLHQPFTLKGYLEHCIETYFNYKCDTVVFIGDLIDSHFASYHETSTEALGADQELDLSIKGIRKWYKAFPKATVIIGNHDRLVMRKANTGGISAKWIRPYNEVLEVPNWVFTNRIVIDNVQYIHGESGRASKKAKDDMISTVQGHRHTEMFVEWIVGYKQKIFGCAVGCGVDNTKYGMYYASAFKKPAIGCAVIEKGLIATNVPMEL